MRGSAHQQSELGAIAGAAMILAPSKLVRVEKTHNWRSDFDAYYNSGTGLVENNMPSVAALDESEEWQKAFYIFRKCMADQGFPLETRK